jgi:hypothetical protein
MTGRELQFCLIASVLLSGCATHQMDVQWTNFTTVLSGATVSISAPRGHFTDVNVPAVDLAANQKSLLLLFERSWVASEFGRDKGGMELKLLLAKYYAKNTQQEFMEAVRLDYQRELTRVGLAAELINPTKRAIGNREWTCFVVKGLRVPDCVFELSADYYLIWRRTWIANSSNYVPDDLAELANQVERSVNVVF